MNGYSTNPNNWKVVYELEYIDDKRIWDLFCAEKLEVDEAYQVKQFDNLGEAITLYSLWQFNQRVYDCKLFARWETESGEWYEEYIAFESTYKYNLRSLVDREMRERMDKAEKRNIELATQNAKMAEFLKKYGVDPYKVITEEVS